jgi:hypothetical protein
MLHLHPQRGIFLNIHPIFSLVAGEERIAFRFFWVIQNALRRNKWNLR